MKALGGGEKVVGPKDARTEGQKDDGKIEETCSLSPSVHESISPSVRTLCEFAKFAVDDRQ